MLSLDIPTYVKAACIFDTGHPCYSQLTADQYHMTILRAQLYNSSRTCGFLKLTPDQVLVFHWIVGSTLNYDRIVTAEFLEMELTIFFLAMDLF